MKYIDFLIKLAVVHQHHEKGSTYKRIATHLLNRVSHSFEDLDRTKPEPIVIWSMSRIQYNQLSINDMNGSTFSLS